MSRLYRHRVLVLDDQTSPSLVRDVLQEAGYAVTLASTGVSALNLVIHLILAPAARARGAAENT